MAALCVGADRALSISSAFATPFSHGELHANKMIGYRADYPDLRIVPLDRPKQIPQDA